jgi:ribonuclease HI
LRIRSDSELLVRQMQGRYKVKSADLKPLHERAAKLARQIQYFVIEHVRRELNSDADALANIALDQASERRTVKSETAKPLQASLGDSQFTAANGSAELPPTSSNAVRASLKIRARFQNGVLVPTEPLDLPEGSEVTLDVCK